MNKITAIIVDDEANARKALANMLEFYCPEVQLIGEAAAVQPALESIKQLQPQLVFLDIHMPGGSGFDLIKHYKSIPFKVIFVTAHEQFALQAIKLSAVDYLMKPVNPRELKAAMEKVIERIDLETPTQTQMNALNENIEAIQQEKKIILSTTSNIYVQRIRQIIRIEADENYAKVCTIEGSSIMVSKSLKEFEELLSPLGFCRVHQSHLLNLSKVVSYDKSMGTAVMENGEKVPVAVRRREFFLEMLQGRQS
jgi:two-component system LytT family response regulator